MNEIRLKSALYADWMIHLIYLTLGMLAYVLCINYSKDWIHYQWWYGLLDRISWHNWLMTTSLTREPVYNFSAKLFGGSLSFPVFVGLATVSLLFLKLRYLAKIVGNPYVATLFYASLYLFLFEGTVLRVAYATACIIPGLYFLQQKRYWLSLAWICLAGLVHFTVVIYLTIFLIYYAKPIQKLVFWMFVLAPLLIIFDYSALSLFRDLITMINPRYLLYLDQKILIQNTTGLYFYFIGFFGLVLLAIEFFLAPLLKSDRFALALQRMAMLGVALMCAFHDYVAVGARLGELLLLPLVILLSWLYLQFDDRGNVCLRWALIIGFTLYMIARVLYLYPGLWH